MSGQARSVLVAVPAVLGGAALITALILLPPAVGAGLLTACSAGTAAVMIRAAATGRVAGPRTRAAALAAGVLLTALAGAGSGLASWLAPDVLVGGGVPLPAEIPLVTIFLVALLYLPAVLRPRQPRDVLSRLRVGLDILGVTACLMFPCWLLMFSGGGERRGASITALIFGGGAAAAVAVIGLHAVRHRGALRWCGPAAALSLISSTAIVVGLDHPGHPNADIATLVAAAAINVAAVLLWYGSVRLAPDTGAVPPPGSESAASFPLLTVLSAGAALVAVYHLMNGGAMDATTIALGATAVIAVVGREWASAVTLRRQAQHLITQGNRLRGLMFGTTDVAMVLDSTLAVRWQSPAVARQFGLSDQEVLGRSVCALVHRDHVDAVHRFLTEQITGGGTADGLAVRLRDGFGRWRETEWSTSGADPAEPGANLVVHVRDVTGVRDLEQTLRESAHLDRQTGLANRDGLLRAAELTPGAGAVLVVELDGLTAIGDVHGPDVAEIVLVEAARRLRVQVTGPDITARLGETRFVVLTGRGAIRAQLLAGQVVNALSAPYPAAGVVAHLSAWAGLADRTGTDLVDEVIRRATLALRSVRSGPTGAVEWYAAEMEQRLLRRSTLEQDLPGALARGEIDLLFQPIVELTDRGPAGVEVVPVWRHRTLGPVEAAELRPLAEDLGLLTRLTESVLRRSGPLLAGWRRQYGDLRLSVDVRPRELLDPAFQVCVQTVLEGNGLPYPVLTVEIAEQHLLDAQPAIDDLAACLGQLRALGVRTAVDDFGTGPISLSRLRILPIDLLKVGREVYGHSSVMDVTVSLGQRLGMEVIALDLRDQSDIDAVRSSGCRIGQGPLLGRPMPAERLEALWEDHRSRRPL
ncbi:EAL domain-containing protein [Actinoplanes sp. G11-F43]|uniref:EAL domain-containing protein n=1 Tax=Actinoplanes sp. G11-F43 TaxID=3424130 RepID=UPI003D340392